MCQKGTPVNKGKVCDVPYDTYEGRKNLLKVQTTLDVREWKQQELP